MDAGEGETAGTAGKAIAGIGEGNIKEREMDKNRLMEEACQELLAYGVWDGKKRLKYLIKRYLLRRKAAPEDLIFWPTGLLAAGLWQYRQEQQEEDAGVVIDLVLSSYYERWFRKRCPILWLDDLLAGETMLALYERYREKGPGQRILSDQEVERYRQAIDRMADYALAYPTDETGSFPYRTGQDRDFVFVDTIGLACPFLYRYGTVFDRPETMEAAVKQIVNFLAYGMDAGTGLPYHGYSVAADCKYGIVGWGRAVGWLLRGMSGCMTTRYGADRLWEPYAKLAETTAVYQRKDGSFPWQLQAAEGPADTSATGMICAAIRQGIALGILEEATYGQVVQAGRNALEKWERDGRIYQCSGECEGFGQYPQRYDAYPWSLGPALML